MKNLLSTTGLVLAILLFLGFNVLSGAAFKSMRVDLTENRLYTLSPGTLNLLSNLQEPIKLKLFFSKKLASEIPAAPTSYGQRVQELLEQYVARSHGKISLEVIDPQPYTDEEDRAAQFGLDGKTANAAGEMFYFGLAGTNSTDQEETIPFFQEGKEDSLEYEVTRLVYTLSSPKKRVVGLLSKLPIEGNPMARFTGGSDSHPWTIYEEMKSSFEVKTIPPTTEKIDPSTDVLMVVHPQGLSPRTLFAIDQFVLGGGKVLAFVDPFCEAQPVPQDPSNPMAGMMANRSSDLAPLLASWGLEMQPDDIAGDRESAMRVRTEAGLADYIAYLALRGDRGAFNKEDFVTSKLEVLHLATAGVLKKKVDVGTTITPLIETTSTSMRVNRSKIMFRPDPQDLNQSFVSGNEKLMLAARVSGPAKTAYPDGQPKVETPEDGHEKKEDPPIDALKESKEINVIVVADCDLLSDSMWIQMIGGQIPVAGANNGDFVINALDNLSGSNDLISLRSRGRFSRPFDRVADIRRASEKEFGQKVKELEAKVKDAEARISEIQSQKGAQGSMILTDEARKEVEQFQQERLKTRKELRANKHDRDKDIEALGSRLKFVNTFLIPILIFGLAVVRFTRTRTRKDSSEAATTGSRT
jgi:gliding motility-associatede transport system auxiliary component